MNLRIMKATAAAVAVAGTLCLAGVASAQTSSTVVTGTINVMGDIVDPSGRVIGHLSVGAPGSTTTLVAPAIPVGSVQVIKPSSGTTTVISTPSVGSIPTTTSVVKRTVTTTTTPVVSERVTYMSDVLNDILTNRLALLQQQINILPLDQTIGLRAELDRIAAVQAAACASGNRISFGDAIAIAQDLDALNQRVALTGALQPLPSLVIMDASGGRQIAVQNMQLY